LILHLFLCAGGLFLCSISRLESLAANPHTLQIPHLYHGLALCYTRLTEWGKVIEYNQLALDADPDFVPAYESLGEAYQMQSMFLLLLVFLEFYYYYFLLFLFSIFSQCLFLSRICLSASYYERSACFCCLTVRGI
jgi:hypothetical protein